MFTKIRKTCIVILVSTLIIIPLSFNNGCKEKSTKKAEKISQKKRQKKIEDLYKEALADVKEEKYASATSKLTQALKVDPNNKKVQAKLKEVKALAKKKGDTATGTTQTGGSTSENQTTPSTTGSATTTTGTPSTQTGTAGSNTSGSSTTTSGNLNTNTSSGSTQTGETKESALKDIPSDATPLSVLPEKLTSYSTASRGWITEPSQAQGRYSASDKDVRKEVEMALVIAAKFEKESIAKAHYDSEKELFPVDSKTMEVNGHNAYFGTYAESKPDLFPPSSTFIWTRGEWVFAVRVIPANRLPADRLKDISKSLAEQVKY